MRAIVDAGDLRKVSAQYGQTRLQGALSHYWKLRKQHQSQLSELPASSHPHRDWADFPPPWTIEETTTRASS